MHFFHSPHFSIRTKLTVPYIILALLIALAGGLIVTNILLGSLEERFTNQLIETRKLASELMVREEDRMLGTLRLVTHTQGLAETIPLDDTGKILDLVYPVTFNAEEDAVLVLDSSGKVITSIIKSEENGEYLFPNISDDMTRFPFVTNVVKQEVDAKGDKYSGIASADWGAYFFVSGPLKNQAGELSGVILVGKSLKGLVSKIREETLSQATIYDTAFDPVISTFPEIPPKPLNDPLIVTQTKDQQSLIRDFDNSSISYTELLGTWTIRDGEDIGFIGTALPKTFLVRTSSVTKTNVLFVFIFAIIMAMLLGLFLSNLITRPILKLKQAASDVAGGNLDIRVDETGSDEVAILAKSFNEMVTNLNQSEKDLISAYDKTIEGWSKALELRDQETQGHTMRVTEMTLDVARAMKFVEDEMINIRRGALLHDIGKIGIPDSILLKPGPLDDQEWEIMRKHPVFAREMLKQIIFLHPAMDIPSYHHEKWDGSGYPFGMLGKEIPITARIFAIVDVWDALTSDRPYRKALTHQEALDIIMKDPGTHFDPDVVKAFHSVIIKQYVELQLDKPARRKNKSAA